ncbi:hypothetical protein LWI29_005075 [Acer saccharum]|uniref:RING-type domain-containing protein n=1 Tax=Acer saccharum TaxID=4024 RepID=A0AA39RUV5_ACESA|nr:hypothetical protein LWI29_005075 [Acer saccharum]
MSALPERRDSLAGLTLDAILSDKRGGGPTNSRTLFDIIREDPTTKSYYGHKDRKSWKLFRDKLRLKRAGAAWTSSVHIPTSDIPIRAANTNSSSHFARRGSAMSSEDSASDATARPLFTRRSSTRLGAASSPTPSESNHHDDLLDISMPNDSPPSRSFRPQISRHNSTRMAQREGDENAGGGDPFEVAREGTRRLAVALLEERVLSAREAVAAQEAAEAAAAEAEAEAEALATPEAVAVAVGGSEADAVGEAAASSSEEVHPVRMSLMDLLEETDREMGVEGSKYMMGEDDEEEFEEDEEEEEVVEAGGRGGGMEYNCCVCMVRHKGAAFIPCGHTFCRLCSRELWVQRGNCPLCNNFIVEILDIF